MFDATQPALVLAPMEGITDAPMRALQGEIGTFTYAVTEFLRVSNHVPPRSLFLRHVPELAHGMHTPTRLPVQVQLLGGDPDLMAATAARACELGATGIDLNFGCPAKTVNRHDGGATLLKHPTRLRAIVAAVRGAVPPTIPVSAKLRLGWDDITAIETNAAMATEGGATWLTIHARTRMAGYAPPVFWLQIGRVRRQLALPIIANGDIWTLADFRRCRDETGCMHFMLGRGALANPLLVMQVAQELDLPATPHLSVADWPTRLQRLSAWMIHYGDTNPEGRVRRQKQWLSLAARFGTFAVFDRIKRARNDDELLAQLASERFCSREFLEPRAE